MTTVALVPFFIIVLCGWVCRFIKPPVDHLTLRKALTFFALEFSLPALFFKSLATESWEPRLKIIPIVVSITIVLIAALTYFTYQILNQFFKRSKINRAALGTLILTTTWANITFLGLPILTALFGTTGTKVAILCDVFSSGPLIYTFGAFIAATFSPLNSGGTQSLQHRLKSALFNFLKLKPLWAACLGFAFHSLQIPLPPVLITTLDLLARALSPLMIFSVGLALEVPTTSKEFHESLILIPAILLKLFIAPGIARTLLLFIPHQLQPAESIATILEMSMSTMVVTLMLCDFFSLDTKLAARMIALTTVLSFFTVPFWINYPF